MLQKSPHELHDIQDHGPPTVASGLFILEKDVAVLDFNTVSTGAYSLGVDHPVLIPDILGYAGEEIAL